MNNLEINNNVQLIGTVNKKPIFNHCIFGENIYKTSLIINRESGIYDEIPICISERLIDISLIVPGIRIKIDGRYSSYNLKEDDKSSLVLYVFTNNIEIVDDNFEDFNCINIYGSICKHPTFRKTPLGREISDVMIAVNRSYGKSDYIPCICWNRNARYVSRLNIGSQIHIVGRIQSREYNKTNENRVAYEVSVNQISA